MRNDYRYNPLAAERWHTLGVLCARFDTGCAGEKYPPNLIWIMPAKGSFRIRSGCAYTAPPHAQP